MAGGAIPESMPSDGTLKVTFVPVWDGKVATLEGATAQDLSCYLTADGWAPGTDEAVVTDSRLCTKQEFEQPGRVTETLEITYVWNTDVEEDEARQTLKRGTVGYLVTRWGIDYQDAYTATQEVDVYPIKTGIARKQPPEANTVHKIMQKAFVTGEVLRDQKLVA